MEKLSLPDSISPVLLFGLIILSQMSRNILLLTFVALVLFVPGLKDKVISILNNGYSRVSGSVDQGSSSRDAEDSPASG
jgi:hypothetical protein